MMPVHPAAQVGLHILLNAEAGAGAAHLIVLLIDERPEEVTDMQRSVRALVDLRSPSR